eukprot:3744380-Pyramimonas_sp.AAC.1
MRLRCFFFVAVSAADSGPKAFNLWRIASERKSLRSAAERAGRERAHGRESPLDPILEERGVGE